MTDAALGERVEGPHAREWLNDRPKRPVPGKLGPDSSPPMSLQACHSSASRLVCCHYASLSLLGRCSGQLKKSRGNQGRMWPVSRS